MKSKIVACEEVHPLLAGGAGYKRETFNISSGCLTGISVNMPQTELLIPSVPLTPVLLQFPPIKPSNSSQNPHSFLHTYILVFLSAIGETPATAELRR